MSDRFLIDRSALARYPKPAVRAVIDPLHNAGLLANRPRFEPEQPLPTLVSGDIALTSTPPKDGAGARAQVARRPPDGSWLRLLDQPEFVPPTR
ncbi:DUF4440 domain-containing protein [Streptomyces flaveus]|uniref:Uncharacterized protein n=1 Tax=Streptomyces flaveus TaxID=66370 RepID=A0A917VR72_9ACTN|nr:hypothetical protein GCM10010094_78580 [Streptomyces flaveus]